MGTPIYRAIYAGLTTTVNKSLVTRRASRVSRSFDYYQPNAEQRLVVWNYTACAASPQPKRLKAGRTDDSKEAAGLVSAFLQCGKPDL